MSSGSRLWAGVAGLLLCGLAAADERGFGLRGNLQADDRSGIYVGGGVDLQLSEGGWLSLDGAHSDAGSDFGNLESSLFAIRWDQRFAGPLGFDAGWETWGDSGVVETDTLHLGLSLSLGEWRIGLDGRWRDIDFSLVVPNPPGADITGGCNTSDTALGGNLTWSGERGSWYLRGRSYDYARTRCRIGRFTLDPFNLPPLAIIRIPALERLQASAVSRTNSFFDSSVAMGGSLRFGRRRVSLEYLRDVGAFDDLASDTVSLGLSYEFASGLDLGFTVGVTDTEIVGSTAFAGLNLAWYR